MKTFEHMDLSKYIGKVLNYRRSTHYRRSTRLGYDTSTGISIPREKLQKVRIIEVRDCEGKCVGCLSGGQYFVHVNIFGLHRKRERCPFANNRQVPVVSNYVELDRWLYTLI